MKRKRSKAISILLVLAMVVSLSSGLTVTASAAEDQTVTVTNEAELIHAIHFAMGTAENPVTIRVESSFEFTPDVTLENINLVIPTGKVLTVKNTITMEGNCTITGGGMIKRGEYAGTLLKVGSNGTLTMSDITVDGGALWNTDKEAEGYEETVGYVPTPLAGSVISEAELLCNEGAVTLGENAVLQNNYSSTMAETNADCRSAGIYNTGTLLMETGSVIQYNAGYNCALYNTGTAKIHGTIAHNYSTMTTEGQYHEQAACIYNEKRLNLEVGCSISQNKVYWTLIINKNACYVNGGSIDHNEVNSGNGTIIYSRNYSSTYYNGGVISYNKCVQATLGINEGVCDFKGTEIAYNTGKGITGNWRGRIYLTAGHIHDNGTDGKANIYRNADSVLYVYGTMNLRNDDGTESVIHMDVDSGAGSVFIGHTDNKFVIHPCGSADYGTRAVMEIQKAARGIDISQFSLSEGWPEGSAPGFVNNKTQLRVGKSASLVLYPNYEGGDEPITKNIVIPSKNDFNAVYGELPVPTREDYVFDGWYTAAEGGTLVNATSQIPNKDKTELYAHWTQSPNLSIYTTVSGYTGAFDGQPHSITVSTMDGASIQYRTTENEEFSTIKPEYTDVGTYTVYYKVTKEGWNETTGSAIVTINRLNIGTFYQNRVYNYSGKECKGNYNGNLNVYFDVDGTELAANPGEYLITCKLKDAYVGKVTWAVSNLNTDYVWENSKVSAAGSYPNNTVTDELVLRWAIRGVIKTDVTLSFEEGTENKATVVGTPYKNAASGAPDGATITYSSNKTSVATVAEDGTVTPVSTGAVKITASYAGDENHNAASISYWLTITSDDPRYHSVVNQEAIEPTCEEGGYTSGSICHVCDEVFFGIDPVSATGHDYQFTANANVITGVCKNDDTHVITATIHAPSDAGGEATIIYSEKWPADEQNIAIRYRTIGGNKTAYMTYGGATASITYPAPAAPNNSSPSRKPTVVITNEEGGGAVASRDGTVTITPNENYEIDTVLVNGKEVKVPDNGKLTGLKKSDTVIVTFKKIAQPGGNPFVDVSENAYYADAVLWAVENGITTGTTATTFSPDDGCTRAQAVTFLWRAAGSPEPTGSTMPFEDVDADSYYYDAVLWAVERGVAEGTSATTFSPDAVCTRAHIVTFLYRNAGSPAISGSNGFTDVAADAYYASAVQWAVNEGITTGTSDTTFSPADTCTRGQIVTFLFRAAEG